MLDGLPVSSDFNSTCLTELNGGSNFVTDRFFENSGCSFENIGAKRKIKMSVTRQAKEKLSLCPRKINLFLKKITKGATIKKIIDDNAESAKLKFKTANAELESLNSNLM